jgi:acyl-homoserine-lactone acylase
MRGVARSFFFVGTFCVGVFQATIPLDAAEPLDGDAMARSVTIHRDEWGVPHVDGPTDASVAFGFAYAQAEDYFWQIEDTYLQCIGRYAEVVGEGGLQSDLINRSFEVPQRCQRDLEELDEDLQAICRAYAAGVNHYLAHHPETTPRLITHFEPWHVLAYERFVLMSFIYGKAHVSRSDVVKLHTASWAAADRDRLVQLADAADEQIKIIGSNAFALSGSRTKSGKAMLLVNPHQPYYGTGQFYEGHVRSGEGLNFSGSTFFGGPLPTMGRNEYLGWAHTVNDPDIADAYLLDFDDAQNPLNYRYDGGHREADEWQDTIRIRRDDEIEEQTFTFRKTHLGPIVARRDDNQFVAVRFAQVFEGSRLRQASRMLKAKNLDEWRSAMGMLSLQMFNTVYADRDDNIYYLYNGAIPRRDPSFDWAAPVDGGDPRTAWDGLHTIDELPQVLNPPSGFVQNCNSSPFTTTDVGNPFLKDYPSYMVEERYLDTRRAKVSRMLLRELDNTTFADWSDLAYDTTLYWPLVELPRYKRDLQRLRQTNPELADQVEPYLKHLLDWDCRITLESTQATLCGLWYMDMYGIRPPANALKPQFVADVEARFESLVKAASLLQALYGDWKVAWGDVSRLQRHPNQADMLKVPFSDSMASVPCAGAPGPLGIVFNTYYMPISLFRRKQYGVAGHSFVGVYEFGDKVTAGTALQYGESSDPDSPHFMDQAELFSDRRFKTAWFEWDDVLAHAVRSYHPGEENSSN